MSGQKKLPKGWRWKKLGEVCEVTGGGTPSRKVSRYFEGDIPWATPTDVTALSEMEISSTATSITEDAISRSSTKLMPVGCVLLTSRATIGYTAINTVPICTNQGFANFQCGSEVLNYYLAFYLPFIKNTLLQLASGATFKEINKTTLKAIEIPLPPSLEEQERIVEVLQQADAIRRKRAEARRLSDQILPALFLDMFGDPIANPKRWPMEPIGNLLAPEIVRVNPAKAFPDDEFTYIEIANIDNTQFRIVSPKKILGSDAPSRARQVVRTGDVLCSMTRPNLRNVAVVTEEYDGAIATTGFAVLRPKRVTDAAFVFEIVKSPSFTHAMAHFAKAKSLYPAVDEPEVRRFQIMTPPSGFREQFAANYEFLSDLDSNTRQAGVESDTLFSNVLSRAFTGELQLRGHPT